MYIYQNSSKVTAIQTTDNCTCMCCIRNDPHNWPGRWNHLQKLLVRGGPLAHPDFEPGPEVNISYNYLND